MAPSTSTRERIRRRLATLVSPPEAASHSLLHPRRSPRRRSFVGVPPGPPATAFPASLGLANSQLPMIEPTPVGIRLPNIAEMTQRAVADFWQTLAQQGDKQRGKDADRGERAAVTGGKQMDGFCQLVSRALLANGIKSTSIHLDANLELPGYFRPTKTWDMLIISQGRLVAAIEFKSQRGPSFGNNFNNRTEEAIGTTQDLWTAYREGAFGRAPRPWLGWVMLLEDCAKSTNPVKVLEPHFEVFPEFRGASYAGRYELLFRRLTREKLLDRAAFIMSPKDGAGAYSEPAPDDLGMKPFLAGLLGHAISYEESLR